MTAFTFRPLTARDAEAYRALRLAVAAVSPVGTGNTLAEERNRPIDFYRSQLAFDPPSTVFAAFDGDQMIATAGIRWPTRLPSGRHMTILYGVQTAPAFRRQALGRRLVRQAIDHAFAQGSLRVYLYVYLPNPEARALYESLGCVASGTEPEVLNIDGRYHDLLYMSLRNPAATCLHPDVHD